MGRKIVTEVLPICCIYQTLTNFILWIIDSCFESGRYLGHRIKEVEPIYNAEACQIECQKHPECYYWSYWHTSDFLCYLQDTHAPQDDALNDPPYFATRGPKFCQGKQTSKLRLSLCA